MTCFKLECPDGTILDMYEYEGDYFIDESEVSVDCLYSLLSFIDKETPMTAREIERQINEEIEYAYNEEIKDDL